MKADVRHGFCYWTLENNWAIVQLWATLLLMHLFPSILIVLLSAITNCRLLSASSQFTRPEDINESLTDRRPKWNRQMTIIVSIIVIAFLIPEVSYFC